MSATPGRRSEPAAQPTAACAVCGGGFLERGRHGWLSSCSQCGVLRSDFTPNIPSQKSGVVLDEEARAEGLAPLRAVNNQRLLAALAGRTSGRRLLDVGCGPGFFLKSAREAGYETVGIEPDANTVGTAATQGEVRHGYFPDVSSPEERFDAIVLNDVLEHMPAPDSVVAACRDRLATGGVLILNCPSREGLFYRVAETLDRLGAGGPYERLWQRGMPSPHLWYFTPAELDRLAARQGLRRIGAVRLDTISLAGLWRRISYVEGQPLPMRLAAFGFSLAVLPFARAAPSDSVAVLFARDDD